MQPEERQLFIGRQQRRRSSGHRTVLQEKERGTREAVGSSQGHLSESLAKLVTEPADNPEKK